MREILCLSYFIDRESHQNTSCTRHDIVSKIFSVRSSIFNMKAFSPTGYRKILARTPWSGYGWIWRQEGWSSHHPAWEDWREGKMQHIIERSHIM